MRRHLMPLVAFLVQPDPPALALGEVVLDAHGDDGADAGEGEGNHADQRPVAQPDHDRGVDAVQKLARLFGIQHLGLPGLHNMLRAADRVGRVSGDDLTGNQPVEQSMDNGKVRFRWKDYRDGNRQKKMTLPGSEFIRRFLIHVLPCGFHRIRYYGFLGNCHRARKLDRYRVLLGCAPVTPADLPADYRDRFEALTGRSLRECPCCHTGLMVVIGCVNRPRDCRPVPDTS
jgi:hypothetical protein